MARNRLIATSLCGIAYAVSSTMNPVARAEPPMMTLPQPTQIAATLTFQQIRDGVAARYAALKAVEVAYEMTTDVEYTEPGSREIITRVAQHFAFKGERRFAALSVPPRGNPSGQPAVQAERAFDGTLASNFSPRRHTASLDAHKFALTDTDFYLSSLAIPLEDRERSRVNESDEFLPYALDLAEADWNVAPKLELVDGARCHVLVSKRRQRLWIDPAIGHAMRFRELCQRLPDTPVEEWPLMSRDSFSEFRDVQEGVWLPGLVESVSFVSARAPQNLWNRVRDRTQIKVSKLAVNEQVPDSLFHRTFPAGTLVNDHVRDRAYRIGNSGEELELLASAAERALDGPVSRRRSLFLVLNVAVLVIAAAVILCRWILTKKRARR